MRVNLNGESFKAHGEPKHGTQQMGLPGGLGAQSVRWPLPNDTLRHQRIVGIRCAEDGTARIAVVGHKGHEMPLDSRLLDLAELAVISSRLPFK